MKKLILTKAAKNVVEVIEIIIAFFQHSFVPNSFVYLFVGLCHCAGAEREQMKWNKDYLSGVHQCAKNCREMTHLQQLGKTTSAKNSIPTMAKE